MPNKKTGSDGKPGRWSDEETSDPLYADERNFYKVELWTADEGHITELLYAGSNLDTARDIFARFNQGSAASAPDHPPAHPRAG